MDKHLTVKEATKLTGKSESTIKRLLREITADSKHEDRQFILPTHVELKRLRDANEPYAWKIDRLLLLKRYPQEVELEAESVSPEKSEESAGKQVVDFFRERLESQDAQIQTLETQLDRKDKQIDNLNERMRESNVLMNELQKRLAIAAPVANASTPIDAEPATNSSTSEPPKPTALKKHLPTFFGLFRSTK